MRRRLAALLLVCLLLTGCAANTAPAVTAAPTATPAPSPSPASTAPPHPYEPLRGYFDALRTDRGCVRNGVAYLAVETVCAYYDLACSWQSEGGSLTLRLPGLTVEGERGREWLTAGGRYLYLPEGWIEADGRLYLPADVIEHLFGLPVTLAEDLSLAEVGSTGCRLLQAEEDYYVRTTQADDLYWLIHIIYAEAHHESLAGQIGVGNVVLNRVANDEFPATIMAVVLDREHTIQFTPVGTGAVTAEPDEKATIAAYLCLEGFNTAGDALYFVNPVRGDASWFVSDLTKVCTIGNHVFYK